jgi:hypothetical protein
MFGPKAERSFESLCDQLARQGLIVSNSEEAKEWARNVWVALHNALHIKSSQRNKTMSSILNEGMVVRYSTLLQQVFLARATATSVSLTMKAGTVLPASVKRTLRTFQNVIVESRALTANRPRLGP